MWTDVTDLLKRALGDHDYGYPKRTRSGPGPFRWRGRRTDFGYRIARQHDEELRILGSAALDSMLFGFGCVRVTESGIERVLVTEMDP